jgi:xanthine dehydrogenase accessory factor
VDPIYHELAGFLERGQPLAFAVLVETKGSTPQKCGAKAIFLPDGRVIGTLGGGCLEAETRQKALRALETGEPFTFRAVLDDDFGWDDGLICGGAVQTFVQPNPQSREVWRALLAEPDNRQRRMLVTVMTGEHAGKRALFAGERLLVADAVPSEVLSELAKNSAQILAEPEPEPSSLILHPSSLPVYFEPILPKPTLVIFGGGHIGAAVGKLAAWSGFDVIAVDDRPSFANKERFPDAKQVIVDDPAKIAKELSLDVDTYLCIVTRGHRHDAVILKEVIHGKAAYIGMIGSKRKVRTVMEGFINDGIATAEDFRRVRSPMGVAIHSITVEEIAVSVVAELVAVRRGAQNPNSLSVTNGLADKMVQ